MSAKNRDFFLQFAKANVREKNFVLLTEHNVTKNGQEWSVSIIML
jgi:hypothetical protein